MSGASRPTIEVKSPGASIATSISSRSALEADENGCWYASTGGPVAHQATGPVGERKGCPSEASAPPSSSRHSAVRRPTRHEVPAPGDRYEPTPREQATHAADIMLHGVCSQVEPAYSSTKSARQRADRRAWVQSPAWRGCGRPTASVTLLVVPFSSGGERKHACDRSLALSFAVGAILVRP